MAVLAACVLLALATVAAYSNSLRCPFLFDDAHDIVENRWIHGLWPVWRVFFVESPTGPALHSRPVVSLSLAVNYAMGGLNTLPYHVTNLAIHILAGLTLFGIVRRTLCLPSMAEQYRAAATSLAFVIAGIWTLHPLQTEAVTYIIQRYESMMGMFYLLALYCALRSAASPRPRWWTVGAVAASLAAMGCKEVAVSVPLMILLFDRAFLAGSFREAWRQRWGMYVGLAGAWAAMAAHLSLSGARGGWAGFGLPISSLDYAKSQFGVILHYLRLSFWPSPLVFDYNWPVAETLLQILPGAVVVLGLLAATVYALFRWPKWGTLGAWFFLILAPTSSIMPIADLIFEHRMYLPLVAVAVAAVLAAWAGLRRLGGPRHASPRGSVGWPALVALAVLASLAVATYVRNQDYESEWTLWNDVVQKASDNPRAHYSLGSVAHRQGDTAGAIARYERTLQLEPRYFLAESNLANLLYADGKVDQAIHHYQEALKVNPRLAEPHFNLGNILRRQGKLSEAMEHYEKALAVDPRFTEAHINLANLLYKQGKVDLAIEHYQKALASDPRSAQTEINLAVALMARGEIDAAVAHCQAALKLQPQSAQAHRELGMALFRKGQHREAIAQWLEAVRLRPDDLATTNVVARLLATSPDSQLRNGGEAVKLGEYAVRRSDGQAPELLETLAAAYAEAGRFPEALQAAQRAVEVASRKGNAELASSVRAAIQLYEAGKPLRDPRSPLEARDRDGKPSNAPAAKEE